MAPKITNGDFYHQIRAKWKEAFPLKTKTVNEKNFQNFWKENKDNRKVLEEKFTFLSMKSKVRNKPILMALLQQKVKANQPNEIEVISTAATASETNCTEPSPLQPTPTDSNADTPPEPETRATSRAKPEQEKLRNQIAVLTKKITDMSACANILSTDQAAQLKNLRLQESVVSKKLKRLKSMAKANRKAREKQKRKLLKLQMSNPGSDLCQGVGRPLLEREQPGLQDAILSIVNAHCTADEKRRSEKLRCVVKTLDDLLRELQLLGFSISRMGLYYRFLPRDARTIEGKRHVNTVPVRIIRPQNTMRKEHEDSHFAAATVKHIKEIAILMGEKAVFVLSQDDKAKVSMGIPATIKQGGILMRMDCRIELPDHDFVVAARHKLIPSVYGALKIDKDSVSYSGPTYIAVRSGKHDSSTAYSHARDMTRLLELKSFESFCKMDSGESKPIWILLVDGGPDENPRYPKTLDYASQHFKAQNLDAIFIVTHAPSQSASNPIERRMAPLSKDLVGLILPHDTYGSHLKGNRTIDSELELKNFEKAGNILAEVWGQRVIDGYDVTAEYQSPKRKESGSGTNGTDSAPIAYVTEGSPAFLTESWKFNHVRQSKYLLQISKCNDPACCAPRRTSLGHYLQGQFLPGPVKFTRSNEGIVVADPASDGSFLSLSSRLCLQYIATLGIPFDYYCPSVNGSINNLICSDCGLYLVTKNALAAHKTIHKEVEGNVEEFIENVYENVSGNSDANISEVYMITDMANWLTNPFENE